MKIFVADDSAAIQKVVHLAFTGFDCEILVAETAVSLAAMVKQTTPDIVLADPKLAGVEGPESLKKILGDTKVLLLLGSYESIDESLWKEQGFTQSIKKPFVGRDLIDLVARLCPGLKELPKEDLGGSFTNEPTRTNQMTMTTLDIDLDFLTQPEESDVQLEVEIPQPLVQAKDRGKKAFEEPSGDQSSTLAPKTGIKSSTIPVQQLDLGQAAEVSFDSRNESSKGQQPKATPELDLDFHESWAQESSSSQEIAEPPRTSGRHSEPAELSSKVHLKDRDLVSGRSEHGDAYSQSRNTSVSLDPEAILKPLWPKIQELIRIEIKQYLDLNFKAQIPGIAKEVIAAEIRRLSEEKARINIDN